MRDEFFQTRAALYVAGALPAAERESHEVLAEFHPEFRAQVVALQDALATAAVQAAPPLRPPPGLKDRLLAALDDAPSPGEPEAWVVTDAAGRVEWVNPAFNRLCGYTLDELRGRKPGELLQGPATDPAEVGRIRAALRRPAAYEAELVNYHKDGSRYRVRLRLAPICDDDDRPLWYVARETKIADVAG
jgi:PAS domain S-box-containing protein